MKIQLTVEGVTETQPLVFEFERMVNAGYVGRDQEEVRRHIEELASKGIPGPKDTPTLYPVVTRALTTESSIEVYGDETCGEVEYVLLVDNENRIYVGLGSDHTDRHLEETDIPRSKQICPNVLSQKVWLLDDIIDHWDDLIFEATVTSEGERVLYQKGPLSLIMDPKALMEFVATKLTRPIEGLVIYSGTIGTLPGEFVFGERFSAKLVDPKLKRSLNLSYEISPLDYMKPE